MQLRTILVTTDFSDTSRKALGPALELAKTFGSQLIVAYVEEDRLPPLVLEYAAVDLAEVQLHQERLAAERLREFVQQEIGGAVPCEALIGAGTPHAEIVRLATERKADLIVMATHGRGFISHAILGSTTERVLRRAPCPVLVVRDSGSA
ncbi:MAG TPA: universal stress protein [Candidatus Polarisedimenticolaceae bacterium]|nr:universal stress protein [Candidatus Polarisedimenticolaceae bacterium]